MFCLSRPMSGELFLPFKLRSLFLLLGKWVLFVVSLPYCSRPVHTVASWMLSGTGAPQPQLVIFMVTTFSESLTLCCSETW